ncbi:hypothetical protein A4X17_02265 [Plantibacter sp. H53]|uniref:DUF4276 family protein n=1 Tax=Plantibacter sp. H53 TaxID=1827323 RepID=UPI0007D928A3|nr:DUF4276 family protein [Plantibacter sp. H53]OAN35619.1 hypothetical protein A4X17_02265 [Plantibacter sp. H53]
MNTMIATEGMGEFSAFKTVLRSLPTIAGALTPTVVHVTCQPDGAVKGIAKACEPLLRQAYARKVDLFVLVIDREQQTTKPGELAATLKTELDRVSPGSFRIEVVYKDRTFENWLIADLDALRRQPARYDVSDALIRRVEPDKADSVKALDLLKRAAKGRQYDKIDDGKKIATRIDPLATARNSRSFRHLLHILGHVDYLDQCRRATAASST